MEPIEYNVFESSKCNSHDDDHGWKKVVSRKRNLKQKPADEEANGNQPTGENVNVEAMNENQKAKKTKKSKPKKEMKRFRSCGKDRSLTSCGLPRRNIGKSVHACDVKFSSKMDNIRIKIHILLFCLVIENICV